MTAASAISPLGVAGWLALGLLAGGLFFALLRWNVGLYARGGALWRALALGLGRLLVLGVILTGVARYGAVPLLATALGVLIARPVVTRVMAP